MSTCVVCQKNSRSVDNDIIQCAGHCQIYVHQACYGVQQLPNHKWYCDRCDVAASHRASKVKCNFCPSRDGALKKTSDASEEYSWGHVLCTLWSPELKFADDATRKIIDISGINTDNMDNAGCSICADDVKAKKEDCDLGISIECEHESCSRRFHVTCAAENNLLSIGEAGLPEPGSRVLCTEHAGQATAESSSDGGGGAMTVAQRLAVSKKPAAGAAAAIGSSGSGSGSSSSSSSIGIGGSGNGSGIRGGSGGGAAAAAAAAQAAAVAQAAAAAHAAADAADAAAIAIAAAMPPRESPRTTEKKLHPPEKKSFAGGFEGKKPAEKKTTKAYKDSSKKRASLEGDYDGTTGGGGGGSAERAVKKVAPGKALKEAMRGKSRAVNLKAHRIKTVNCSYPGCNREYYSPQGLRFHLEHNHNSGSNSAGGGGADGAGEADFGGSSSSIGGGGSGGSGSGMSKRKGSNSSLNSSAGMGKKARFLQKASSTSSSNLKSILAVGDMPCIDQLHGALDIGGETTDNIESSKGDVAAGLKQVHKIQTAENQTLLLKRMEEMQRSTQAIVEDAGSLAAERDRLEASIAKLESGMSPALSKLMSEAERAKTTPEVPQLQQNLRDTMMLMLNTLVPNNPHGPLHPMELDDVLRTVSRAIDVAKSEGSHSASVIRTAILAHMST